MKEELEVYDLNEELIKVEERSKFYSEIKAEFATKGEISKQVKSIRLLLLNSHGRIYLQKRSKLKDENPGLYDKTIGGHILKEHTREMTVTKECSEELGFPATVLSSEEFDEAIESTNLSIIGLFREIDYISNFRSTRIDQHGNKMIQPFMTTFYIGYYDGSMRFIDGESSGIEVFTLDELKNDIKNNSQKFTEDIKFMINKYGSLLKPIKG